jgi:molybdenum cofactor biosynthesis protein B
LAEVKMVERSFIPLGIAVVTVSDTRELATDRGGELIMELLQAVGHRLEQRRLVKDELELIRSTFAELCGNAAVDVVIATGGSGLTLRDVTPEALAPLVDKPIPGFGELFRWLSYAEIGASTIQSRAEAAVCRGTLVFVLPGSPGAVRLAMERILLPQLDNRTRPCNFAELLPRIRGEQP